MSTGAPRGLADQAADRLNAALRAHTERFLTVAQPGGSDFFEDNGLLYLSPDDVEKLTNQLAANEPLLGSLAQDPNLRGVLSMLGEALKHVGEDGIPSQRIGTVLGALDNTVRGVDARRYTPLPWQSLLGNRY